DRHLPDLLRHEPADDGDEQGGGPGHLAGRRGDRADHGQHLPGRVVRGALLGAGPHGQGRDDESGGHRGGDGEGAAGGHGAPSAAVVVGAGGGAGAPVGSSRSWAPGRPVRVSTATTSAAITVVYSWPSVMPRRRASTAMTTPSSRSWCRGSVISHLRPAR